MYKSIRGNCVHTMQKELKKFQRKKNQFGRNCPNKSRINHEFLKFAKLLRNNLKFSHGQGRSFFISHDYG